MVILKAGAKNESGERGRRADSDIDVLMELYTNPIGLLFVQMKLDFERLLNREVDLVTVNGVLKYIKPLIDAEKELIYVR